MRKINRSFLIAWSIIAVLVFANVAVATTISTNVTTGGTLDVTGATTLTGLLSAVNASVSGDFELTTNGGDIVALGDLTIEDITASGSLGVTGTTTTGILGVTGATTLTGLLSAVNASVSGNFEVGTDAINPFRVIGSSGDVNLEDIVASGSAVIGYTAASPSTGFVAQFVQRTNTATLSVDFDSGSGVGSCLRLRDAVGALVYCRVRAGGTAFTCSTVSCMTP